MNSATPTIRDLAQRLLALEAQGQPHGERVQDAVRACEKLRVPLVKLAGLAGFRSLLSRAVALAKMEVPSLNGVHVNADGLLEGFDVAMQPAGTAEEAGMVILARLLGLLETFVGEPLTLRLVRDAWPDASVNEANRPEEGQI